MRLIDGEKLFEYLGDVPWTEFKKHKVLRAVYNAPTIDAVPVVRCKECDSYVEVAWRFDNEGKKKECHCCVAHSIPVQPNDYCSYGERREP